MAGRKEGYISQDSVSDLKNIASNGETYSKEEFLQLEKSTEQLYKDVLKTKGLTDKEKNQLKQMHSNLKKIKIKDAEDVQTTDIQQVFLALNILLPDSLYIEDKDFFDNAQTELLGLMKEYNEAKDSFKTGIQDIENEVRLSQSNDQESSYIGADEKTTKSARKRSRKLERKERKGKDRDLMRETLKGYLGEETYNENKDVLNKVTDLLDETSMTSLMGIYRTWFAEGKEVTKENIEEELEDASYVHRGRKLDRKEKRQIVELYTLLGEQGGSELFDGSAEDEGLVYLIRTLDSDTSLADTIQTQTLTASIESIDAGDTMTTLRNLIGDINYDGSLVNAPDPDSDAYRRNYKEREKAWESVDKSLVMGTSLHKMMIDAEHFLNIELGEGAQEQVAKNIAGALAGYTARIDITDIASAEDLLALFTAESYLLAATQQMLLDQGANARFVLQYGVGNADEGIPSYTDVMEAIAAQQTVDLGTEGLEDVLSLDQMVMIDGKLSDCFEQMIDNLEEQLAADPELNTPEMEAFVSSLAQDKVGYTNKWKVNTIGALVSVIKGNEGVGLGASTNVWVNKNLDAWVQQISVGGGVFLDKSGSPAVGVSLSASAGKSFGAKDQHTFFYAGGVGAGWGKNGLIAGPYIAPGVELQVNTKKIGQSLDPKAAQHIGFITNASLAGVGGGLYRSRDKLKGYTQAKSAIEGTFGLAFAVLEDLDEVTMISIVEALKEQYPKTKQDTLVATAQNMLRIVKPFGDRWATMDDRVKGKIIDDVSKRYALNWYNQHVESLGTGRGSLHVSQLGVGLQYIAGFVFPTAGLGLSWYKESTYSETPESVQAIKEAQEKGYGAREVAEEITDGVVDNMNKLFGLVDGEELSLTTSAAGLGLLHIPSSLISREGGKVNLHMHPTMKQFVSQDGAGLQIHHKTPITIMSTYRQGKTEYDLIIGATGLAGTEQVLLSDVDEEGTVALGDFSGEPDKYAEWLDVQDMKGQYEKISTYLASTDPFAMKLKGVVGLSVEQRGDEIVFTSGSGSSISFPKDYVGGSLTITKELDGTFTMMKGKDSTADSLDISYTEKKLSATTSMVSKTSSVFGFERSNLSSEVEKTLNDKKTLLSIRQSDPANYSKFRMHMDSVGQSEYAQAKIIAAKWFPTIDFDTEGTDALRTLDVALSITPETINKITNAVSKESVDVQEKKRTISELVKNITFKGKNAVDVERIALGILDGTENFDNHIDLFYGIIKGTYTDAGVNNIKKSRSASAEYQLYWMVADIKYVLLSKRGKLNKYLAGETEWDARSKENFLSTLDALPVLQNPLYQTEQTNGVALVLGYDEGVAKQTGQIEEKFTEYPTIISGSKVALDDRGTKEYYLKNLITKEGDLISGLVEKLKNAGIDYSENQEGLITAIIDGEHGIQSSFYAALCDWCANETIISDITITIEEEVTTSVPTEETTNGEIEITGSEYCNDGVFINSVGTESIATKREKNIHLGIIGGDPTTVNEKVETESHTIITDLEDYIEGLSEAERTAFLEQLTDAMSNPVQPGYTITIDGIDYTVDGWPIPGTDQIIYADTFTSSDQTTMMIYDTVTNETKIAELVFGPYNDIMHAVAGKSGEMHSYAQQREGNSNTLSSGGKPKKMEEKETGATEEEATEDIE